MEVVEHVQRSFKFSCSDAQVIYTVLINNIGKKTIKTALDNPKWYIPLFCAFGKVSGAIQMMDYGPLRFSYEEERILCAELKNAYDSDLYDEKFKDKLFDLINGIPRNKN